MARTLVRDKVRPGCRIYCLDYRNGLPLKPVTGCADGGSASTPELVRAEIRALGLPVD